VKGSFGARGALDWYLSCCRRGWETVPDAEIEPRYRSGSSVAGFRATATRSSRSLGAFVVVDVVQLDEHRVMAMLDADGVVWSVLAITEREPPYRIATCLVAKAPPTDITVRSATPADGPAIAKLIRRSPVVDGAVTRWYDYGTDYFKATSSAGACSIVAEHVGQLVAVHGLAPFDAHFGAGRTARLGLLRHTRIDPTMQGSGLFGALQLELMSHTFPDLDQGCSLVAVGNTAMLDKLPDDLRRWRVTMERYTLDCRSLGKGDATLPGVPCSSVDAIELLDASHQLEYLCRATSPEALASVPAQRRRRQGGAVVAVADNVVAITTEDGETRVTRSEVTALELGCATDAPEDLRRLLREWCGHLYGQGIDDLLCYASSASPLRPLLAGLASHVDAFVLNLTLDPPDDLGERGIHLTPALL